MYKHLFAAAVTALLANSVLAQSSVRLYGTVDLSGRYVKADGQGRRVSESSDGLNSSQLGFSGIEDLGDGQKSGFLLISTIAADTGTTATKFFNRQSYLFLSNRYGELRLGRDYMPTFWNLSIFDAFGFNGLGSTVNARQLYSGTRADNAISYLLPTNSFGIGGQLQVAASEGGTELDRPARYLGGRLTYAAGPLSLAIAGSKQRFVASQGIGNNGVTAVRTALPGESLKTINMAASWNFGVAKLMAYVDRDSLPGIREDFGSIGLVVPIGVSEIHAGYDRSRLRRSLGGDTSVDQIKASYVYNLSTRTAMYSTVSRLSNKDATRVTLGGAAGLTAPGGKSQGFEVGVRHFF